MFENGELRHTRSSYLKNMDTPEYRRLKAKIAVVLQSVKGRVPTEQEIDDMAQTAWVLWGVVVGAKNKRQEMRERGQLAIF